MWWTGCFIWAAFKMEGRRYRAFVAAALRVGHGDAEPADELCYRGLRPESLARPLPAAARADPSRWLAETPVLPDEIGPAQRSDTPAPSGAPVELDGAMKAAVDEACRAFGLPRLAVRRLDTGAAGPAAWGGPPPEVGLPPSMLDAVSPPQLTFFLGRAAAAVCDPRLEAALNVSCDPSQPDASHWADHFAALLDRGGLVACRDPAVALPLVGAGARRRALIAFALSDAFLGIWDAGG